MARLVRATQLMQNWVCEGLSVDKFFMTERFPNWVTRTPAGHDIEGKV